MCNGIDTKYVTCGRNECPDAVEDLSLTVEAICQKASLEDPTILPFGDAQNTSSCRVHCFRVSICFESIIHGSKKVVIFYCNFVQF